jgi:hypothetical protein
MAKTDFSQDGTHITSAIAHARWGNTGATGHDHQGLDEDGSAPQIDLTNAVSGLLPNANLALPSSGTIGLKITTTYLTVEQTFNVTWEKRNNRVTLHIPEVNGTSNSTSLEAALSGGTWPSEIIPGGGSGYLRMTIPVQDNGNVISAMIKISESSDTENWVFYALASDEYLSTNFTNSGTKGLFHNSITYLTV